MKEKKKIVLFYPHVPVAARDAARKVLDSRWIGQGPKVNEFEKLWEEKISKPHKAIAVGSGTDALHLAYILAGIKEGDEVVTPVFTCPATTIPLLYQRAKPVFADIQKHTLNVDPKSVKQLVNERTKAIICVHWGGLPADLDELQKIADKWNIPLIEDAAQAQGATYKGKLIGSISDFACFSFQAIKLITTADGGMLTIKDPKLEDKAKRIRWFGIDRKIKMGERWKKDIWEIGYKYQMSVDYNEPLIYMEGGKIKVEKIGKVFDGVAKNSAVLNNLKVVAFDKNYKLSFKKVGSFIRHKLNEKKLYELTLSTGRKVRVTGSHSVYALDNGELKPKPVSSIKVGDFLAIPKKIPTTFTKNEMIDLKKEFMDLKVPVVENEDEKISYVRKFPDGSLRPSGLYIPRYIKYSPELFRLIGYYVSEGCICKYCVNRGVSEEVSLTFGSQKYIEDVIQIINKIFGNIHIRKNEVRGATQLMFGGVLVATFFKKIIKAGVNAYSKQIPEIVFNASLPLKIEFLKGYFGDGYYCTNKGGGKRLGFTTASEDLASGLLYLLLQIGIPAKIQKKEARKKYILNKLCSLRETYIISIGIGEYVKKLLPIIPSGNKIIPSEHTYRQCIRNFPINHIGLRQLFNETKLTRLIRDNITGRYLPINKNKVKSKKFVVAGINRYETMPPEKVTAVLDYIEENIKKYADKINKGKYLQKINKVRKLLNSDLAFAKVKRIRHVLPTTSFVYDVSVPNMENFVGGFGGIILHNTDVAAAMGIEALKVYDKTLAHHRELFETYREELKDIPGISFIDEDQHRKSSCWLAMVFAERREELRKKLAEHNIESNPIHYRNDRYSVLGGRVDHCPNMDALEDKYLVLPMHYHLSVEDVKYICEVIKEVY